MDELYTANPEAVVNGRLYLSRTQLADDLDRFGDTHWDFQTVEYGLGEPPKDTQMWQFTRGSESYFNFST